MNRLRLLPVPLLVVMSLVGPWCRAESEDKSGDKSNSEINSIINRLDYPEFQVVPRASERLRMEAREEDYDWAYVHWQLEVSGAATFLNGVLADNEVRNDLSDSQVHQAAQAATVGKIVGLGWTAAGVMVGLAKPYRRGLNSILKYSGKDERTALLRERLAEEAIENEAKLMRPLIWFSTASQFGTNIFVGSYLSDQGRIIAGISAFLSFLPLIFDDHSLIVHEKSLEYKTRIYRPISSMDLGYDAKGRTYIPMTRLTWNF